jgi:RND family efflux transporter MFP subunit
LQRFKRIVAPFAGVITSRTAEVGMLVTAGKESLFVVEDLSRIRVQMNVPQTYAMQATPGTTANVVLPESSLAPVAGQITRIAESVDPASRTMLAEIELDNTSHRFQPGSYAQVQLALPQHGAAWTIPTNTLSMRVDGPHVAVVDDEFQVELKRVTLGRDLGNRIIVTGGIQGDERLVVNPSDDLASGDRVKFNGPEATVPRLAQR